MLTGADLARALAGIAPASFSGDVARRVGLAGLLTPLSEGGKLGDLEFLYASRRRNRFTPGRGAQTIYFGEDEDIGAAETKRTAFLGTFAKTKADPAAVFWAHAHLPGAVLDLTNKDVLSALAASDAELHDPEWRRRPAPSPSEYLGKYAFESDQFAAIKYWSVRARLAGKGGFCLCIFKSRVRAPMKVSFTYEGLNLAEQWGG